MPEEASPYTSTVASPFLFELLGFILGLHFGSFLNVCVVRLPAHESVVTPRSHCMSCGHLVRWYDNLPVLSWLLLRGSCRDCKARIPWRYAAVELAVGLWFAILVHPIPRILSTYNEWISGRPSPPSTVIHGIVVSTASSLAVTVIGAAILGFLLIGLIVMDWRTMRLPDAFTLTGIGIGFVLTCVQAFFLSPREGDIVLNPAHQLRLSSPGSFQAQGNVFLTGTEALVMGRIVAIAGAALFLLAIRWIYQAVRKRDGMGLGDVKLMAMIAAFVGFGEALLAFFVGVFAASIYGIALIARKKAGAATKLPLGSFIAAGGLFVALWGREILDWYVGLLR
jgi:leader peptidase (prepilin peptidase)/N-methyltransferase